MTHLTLFSGSRCLGVHQRTETASGVLVRIGGALRARAQNLRAIGGVCLVQSARGQGTITPHLAGGLLRPTHSSTSFACWWGPQNGVSTVPHWR